MQQEQEIKPFIIFYLGGKLMKKLITALLCVALVSTTIISATAESQSTLIPSIEPIVNEQLIPCEATVEDDFIVGEILVGIKAEYSGINKSWIASDFPELDGIVAIEDLTYAPTKQTILKYQKNENFHQILSIRFNGSSKQSVINGISLLQQNNMILVAEPNYLFASQEIENSSNMRSYNLSPTNQDRYMGCTSDEYITEQTAIRFHNIDKVWNAFTVGSQDVAVAVLDDGIYAHEDLSDNLAYGYDFSQTNADGVVSEIPLSQYSYYGGHGTAVASVIGARGNNGKGISGVCQRATIYPYIITRTDSGDSKHMAKAVLKAQVQGVPIVNISYEYGAVTGNIFTLAASIYDGLIVKGAGNLGIELTATNGYAAMYDLDNVIVVGGIETTANDSAILWDDSVGGIVDRNKSSYSSTYVDIMAMAKNVNICTIPDDDFPDDYNSYSLNGGTSLAAPLVAGVAALLLSYDSSLTTAQLKQYIMEGARTTSELEDYCVTGGYLDAYGAFLAMLEDQAYSYKVQIHQYEEAYEYGFTVTYYEDYEHLTEIIIPDAVQVCLMSLDISFEHNKIHVYMELAYLFELEDLPIMEFHFISFNESSVPQTYFSTSNHIVKDVHGSPIANAQIPSKTLLAGDANGDSVVNISDYLAILQHTVGNPSLTGDGLLAADVDGNFVAGSSDALLISNYITDKIYSFY